MSDITLLDGGMGQELVHRAGDSPTPLWSTRVMIDHPGMVAAVHRDFAAAGATVAMRSTVTVLRAMFWNLVSPICMPWRWPRRASVR